MIQRKRTYSGTASRPTPARRRRTAAPARARPRLPYAQAAARQAALLGRTGLSEVKSFDCVWAGGNLVQIGPAAGAEPAAAWAGFTEINCIPQGATVANRIGNKVVVKSIHLKASIVNQVLANASAARIAIIYDKQPNGAFPAITDILIDQPLGAANTYSGLNIANKSRFTMLRDQFFNLDAAQGQIHTINWYIKGRWEVEYGANAGNIGDFRTGAIYLFGIYAGSVINLNVGSARIRYYD